jgi:hypothetical protein
LGRLEAAGLIEREKTGLEPGFTLDEKNLAIQFIGYKSEKTE